MLKLFTLLCICLWSFISSVGMFTDLFLLQDIKELNLTDNPEWEGERRNAKGDRYEDIHCGMFICPVVGLEMNGKHR